MLFKVGKTQKKERLKEIKKTGKINYAKDIVTKFRSPVHKPTQRHQEETNKRKRQKSKEELRDYTKR